MVVRSLYKKLYLRSKIYNFFISKNNLKEVLFIPLDPWPGDPHLAENFFKGIYYLAGKKVTSKKKQIWALDEKDNSWTEEMHSFSWLRHFKARSGPLARKHAKHLINSWIFYNNNWCEKSWKLDILARRVSAWITNMSFLLAEKEENFSIEIRKSMLKQIKHLNNFASRKYFYNLEKKYGIEEGSIKKIKIIRGLLLSAICLEGGQKLYGKGLNLLDDEIENNFNVDGLHKSRSPYSQLSILSDFITIRDCFLTADRHVPKNLELCIKKMAHTLRFFRTNNGTLAAFNGSKKGDKFVIDKILHAADGKARARGPTSLSLSGFEKLDTKNINIFINTLSSNNNVFSKSPHAIEIVTGKNSLLGSCGSLYGKNKEWKKILLSGSAHSCLTINDTNAFTKSDFRQKALSKRYKKNGCEIAELSHYGYYSRFGAICSRKLELGEKGKEIAGLDTIICENVYKFDIRFHFSPDVKVSTSIDKRSAIIITNEFGWNFIYDGDVKLYSEPSIYIDDKGLMQKTTQLLLTGSTNKRKTEILWGLKRTN